MEKLANLHLLSALAALVGLLPACAEIEGLHSLPSADAVPVGHPQPDTATAEAGEAYPRDADGARPIDLASALRLAAGRNLDLARAVERTRLAAAKSDEANLSIVPDLAAGASFGRKNGLLQDIAGAPLLAQRVDRSAGLGASTGMPGVGLDLSLGEAIFAPLAARQDKKAAEAAAKAREHQVLAEAAIAYYELLRAHGHLRLAREIEEASRRLADSTKSFAAAGEGLEADAARARAIHLLRRGDVAGAEAETALRSANLARLLHLPGSLALVPVEGRVAATHLVSPDEAPGRLVATALRHRPEAAAMQAEVSAAAHRMTERKIQPFLPNLVAGYSSYDFAAGTGVGTDQTDPRDEVTALIYWKLDRLGFGDAAETRQLRSELAIVRLEEERVLDEISHQVASARAEALSRRARLPIGAEAAVHARRAYQLTAERLEQSQGLPIEALASIQTLAEARRAEIDAVLDYNVAQHRLLAALGHPASK